VRSGPIGHGIPGSTDPHAAGEAIVRAAPHALVFAIPAVAVAAFALPWLVAEARRLSRRAVQARTYTG
jgi:hypothetical protein